MKRKLFISLIVILVLAFAGYSYISLAQDERPPEGELPRPEGGEPAYLPFSGDKTGELPLPHGPGAALPAARGSALSPSVSLGQPGTSYRYVQTFGVTEVGYLTDAYHLNAPTGLFIDGSNNLYVVEEHGYRLLRYNSSGTNTLSIGIAGLMR